ncbi:MAG: VapC toxin family PIN domain ribonuclease, partial [Chloroflexota bacterium]
PDLLIGAVAERARLTVLHYDKDFVALAKATGQPVEWVVPAGSIA